ncbi:MAG: hypothetical protein JWQ98_52 [Chlorobi bacterium]|nr:hypothetical protein [Chlorobiota bacterium]
MPSLRTGLLLVLSFLLILGSARGQESSDSLGRSYTAGLSFTENRGQIIDTKGSPRPDLLYTAGLGNVRLYFRRDGVSYVFNVHHIDSARAHREPLRPSLARSPAIEDTVESYRMDMTLVGANPQARIESGDPSELTNNYYLPHCPQGITGVGNFRRLIYHDIYPNIDLAFYTRDGALKYDFIVRPGGDPSMIHVRYDGAGGMKKVGEKIVVTTPLGTVEEGVPVAYQGDGIEHREGVGCRMGLEGSDIRFAVERYDTTRALVIDPTLQWATYIGGSGEDIPSSSYWSCRIAVDGQKNIYMMGVTASTDFPVLNGMQATMRGASDEFVVKFSPGGTEIWGTYLGGSDGEFISAISSDVAGNLALAGTTYSHDFPLAGNTFQSQPAPGVQGDMYIATMTPGGLLKWSTYYGGSSSDLAGSVRIDGRGNVILLGETVSNDFPLTTPGPSPRSVFVVKFDAVGSRLWAYAYDADAGMDVTTDAAGNIILTGLIGHAGSSIITAGALQPGFAGSAGVSDVFVLKLDPLGTPIWGTYFGGVLNDVGNGIDADQNNGDIVITGYTESADFPVTPGAAQPRKRGFFDMFVAKLSNGGRLIWSTYFGGSIDLSPTSISNSGEGIRLSPCGDVFVTGYTNCSDFPVTTDAYQRASGGDEDAVLVKFNPRGQLVWSTYLGGESSDRSHAVALDSAEGVAIAGITFSRRFPTTPGALKPNYLGGYSDGFLARFYVGIDVPITPVGPLAICEGGSITLSAPAGYFSYKWSPGGETTQNLVVKKAGIYSLVVKDNDGCPGISNAVTVKVNARPALKIANTGPLNFCVGDSVLLSIAGAGLVSYRWSAPLADTTSRVWVKATGDYSVTVKDVNGCFWDFGPVHVQVNPAPPVPVFSFGDTLWVCTDSSAVLDIGTGTGYRNYRWFDSTGHLIDSTRLIRVKQSGTYSVTVSNVFGCSVSRSVAVAHYPPVNPLLQVHGPFSFCAGDSVLLDVGGGSFAGYQWSDTRTTPSIAVREPGRYFVTVTDANGCIGMTDTVTVTVHPVPVATITGPFFVCTGVVAHYTVPHHDSLRYHWTCLGNGTISGANDSSGVTVAWGNTGQGSLQVSVVDTVSGCSASQTTNINVGTTLKPEIGGPRTFCAGDTIELDAGAGYQSYLWIGGEQTQTIRVFKAGRYGVMVRDIGGCSGSSDTIDVTTTAPRSPVISGPAKVCINSTATYATDEIAGDDYTWSVSGGAITSGAGTHQVDIRWGAGSSGTIGLVERSSAGGCAGVAPDRSVGIGTALEPVITPSGSLVLCPGDTIELDAGAGYASYQWLSGEQTRVIRVADSGIYRVRVSDAGGCSGSSSDLRVERRVPSPVTIAPAGPIQLTDGDSVDLDAGAGYIAYDWGGGRVARHLIVRASGRYAVSVVDSGGCRGSAAVDVVIAPRTGYRGQVVVALGSVEAMPGQRVLLPMTVVSSDNLPQSPAMRGYQARLRFNRSLLLPVGSTPMGVIDGEDRLVTIDGVIPGGVTSGKLADVEFMAALGDTVATVVRLEGFVIGGGDSVVTAVMINGEFHLLGVCPAGGNRLITVNGSVGLKGVRPNPVSGMGEVEYEIVEDGRTEVNLIDALGRRVAVLVDGDISPGAYSVPFSTAGLSSGLYFATLRTRTARLCVAFRITH